MGAAQTTATGLNRLRCSTPTSTPTRGCMTGASERDRHRKVQPMDCVRMVHARRKFVAVYKATHAPLARDVIASLGEVYAIEARIRGASAEERRAVRQAETKPIIDALKTALMTAVAELPSRSSLVEAIKYMLGHWAGLTVFLADGRIEVDTNTVERTMRPIALGRKNAL